MRKLKPTRRNPPPDKPRQPRHFYWPRCKGVRVVTWSLADKAVSLENEGYDEYRSKCAR